MSLISDIVNPLFALFLTLISPLTYFLSRILTPILAPLEPFYPPPAVFGFFSDFFLSFQLAFFPTVKTLVSSTFSIVSPLLWNPILPLTSPHAFITLLGSLLALYRPQNVRRTYMAHLWKTFGPGIDTNSKAIKENLIKDAHGVVLDIGAGFGHTVPYLNQSQVTHYVALEPNPMMHDRLRAMATKYGYTEEAGNFILLDCPAEDIDALRKGLEEGLAASLTDETKPAEVTQGINGNASGIDGLPPHSPSTADNLVPFPLVSPPLTPRPQVQLDTIISILTLCSLPKHAVAPALANLVSLLAPASPSERDPIHTLPNGSPAPKPGLFLLYEHTLNPNSPRTRLWQVLLSPLWRQCFDGCELDRDTVNAMWEAGRRVAHQPRRYGALKRETVWSLEESKVWGNEGEDVENLFWHHVARFVKISP